VRVKRLADFVAVHESASDSKRHFAAIIFRPAKDLFYRLVGAAEDRQRHLKPQRRGGLEIDDKFELGGLLCRTRQTVFRPESSF
jgi:hypothetical protein